MKAEMTEIVMPGDTNHLGTCFGGKIMSWIDMVAAIAANRTVGTVVTASVDSIQFQHPIKVGDVVTLKADVNCMWGTSLEVGVMVEVQRSVPKIPKTENPEYASIYTALSNPKKVCKAYLTFVAVDDKGNKREIIDVNGLPGQTPEEIRRMEEANERREIRLFNRKKEFENAE